MMEEIQTEKKSNVDIRDIIIIILIIVLIGISILFYFNPFNWGKVKQLEQNIESKEITIQEIQKQKEQLKIDIAKVDVEIKKLEKLAKSRRDTIEILKKLSNFKDIEIKDLQSGMDLYNELIRRKSKEIENLLKNPIVLPKNIIVEKSSEKFK